MKRSRFGERMKKTDNDNRITIFCLRFPKWFYWKWQCNKIIIYCLCVSCFRLETIITNLNQQHIPLAQRTKPKTENAISECWMLIYIEQKADRILHLNWPIKGGKTTGRANEKKKKTTVEWGNIKRIRKRRTWPAVLYT